MARGFARCSSLALAVSVSIAVGCGDDPGPPATGVIDVRPVAGCESFDPTPCDVFATSCQTKLMNLAACLRGSAAQALPPVSRMTEAEFAQWLTAEMTAEPPPPDLNHYEAALTLLKLVVPGAFEPASMAAMQASRVLGLYRDDLDDIVLIDRGKPANDANVNGVLLHELVHALQDRDQDLPTWYDAHTDTYDAELAAMSVVEGEARLHEERFAVAVAGLDPSTVDLAKHFDNSVRLAEKWVRMQPSPYLASYTSFPYEFGARLLLPRFTQSGPQAIAGLFSAPPADTRALLDPATDVGTPAWAAPIAPTPPAEWTLTQEQTLGAWAVDLFLGQDGVMTNTELEALGWRGDRFWVYGGTGAAASATAMVWRIAFADDAIATLVIQRLPPGIVARPYGAEVVIAASNTAVPLDWAFVVSADGAPVAGPDGLQLGTASSVGDWLHRVLRRAD